jgi:DNA-binding response OmpR family regulator
MPVIPAVVLIEDHSELGEIIRDVMSEEGYDVLTVRDQFAAVATLRSQRIDLVVADLPDPEPGQADPLSEVTREFPGVPLVTIVDESAEEIPFFGPWRVSGGRATLRRPFKLDDLIAVTREIVG